MLGLNALYRNTGAGAFAKIIHGHVVEATESTNGGGWADFDNDGDPDLFVSNGIFDEVEPNFLYQNDGGFSFTLLTDSSVYSHQGASASGAWGDYDNDGDFDLYATDTFGGNNLLYENVQGEMVPVSEGAPVNDGGFSGGSGWGDYDNDGDLDLFVANGLWLGSEKNSLYENRGDGSFQKITTGSLVNEGGYSWGCSWADYDNDGFLDLVVVNDSQNEDLNFLYRNNGNENHWIRIKCVGTLANRSGIGAKVRVKATIDGQERWQLRQITGGDGYLMSKPLETHFGLGDATIIDEIVVEWPGPNFTRQVLHNVAVDQIRTIVESARAPPESSLTASLQGGEIRIVIIGEPGKSYELQVSVDLSSWAKVADLTIPSEGEISYIESETVSSAHRFYRTVEKEAP